jgi:hypothetical protein
LRDFEVRFIRAGRWQQIRTVGGVPAPGEAIGGDFDLGFIMPAGPGTLVESTIEAPTRIGIVGYDYVVTTGDLITRPVLLIAQGPNRIAVQEARLGADGGSYTGIGGPSDIFGTLLLQYSTSDALERPSQPFAVALGGSTQLVGGAFTCRVNDSASVWQVRIRIAIVLGGGNVDFVTSSPIIISAVPPASIQTSTQIIPPMAVRSITLDVFTFTVEFLVSRVSGSGTTTIDFDEIALIALDTPGATIIVNDDPLPSMKLYIGQGERPEQVTGDVPVSLRNYGANTIRVWQQVGPSDQVSFWPHRGDAMISSSLDTMNAVALTANGLAWRTQTGAAVGAFHLEVTRYPTSLVPQ